MPDNERDAWNQRYREGSHGGRSPDPFLVKSFEEFIEPLFPATGTALDVAGGAGRHAVYLAERTWRVTLADIAEVGIERAHELAKAHGVAIDFLAGDARSLDFGRERFDIVMVFFYLERDLLPMLAVALRPGGLVIYKTYTHEHEKFAIHRLSHPMYFLGDNELLHAFPGFRVLHYRESVHERGIAELVARKPL
jgi:SAM-dependent methyltransferase